MENYYTNSILAKSSDLLRLAKGNLVTQIGNGKQQLAGLLLFVFFLLSVTVNAQYSNVPVTGFNADVVANGATGPAINSTSADVDGGGWVFVDTTFNPGSGVCAPGAFGLPGNRTINSITTPGLSYLLQPYNASNALRLTNGTSGALSLTTPIAASNIYLLALGGGGAASITATITFTDLTTQTATGSAPDWCGGTGPASTVFYRIDRSAATCGGANCQYLFDVNLSIAGPNVFKTIASIQISSAGGILHVMAVGAKAACGVPPASATGFTTGLTTKDSISASFTAASPAPAAPGGYLIVRYPQGATPTAPTNKISYTRYQTIGLGTVVDTGAATSFTARGLSGSTNYDFYIYTYNAGTICGGPIYNTATPLLATAATATCTGTMTGTVLIGPGYLNTIASGYTSITNALVEINANGLGGNTILELQSGYVGNSGTETFPIAMTSNGCVSSSRTLTIRPSSLVTDTLTITGSSATALINLNGASYITFDGRPNGSGSDRFINISNTNAAGAAIQFINDAHHNTFTYCDIQGQNTSATSATLSGVIYFAGTNTSALQGNDYNTFSFCDIHATTGGFPAMGIVSSGSTTNVSSWNDYNTITDCNIYDYFSAGLATTGIKLENGSNAFTINNNRLYQTGTRTYTSAVAHRAFWLTPNTASAASPSGFVVTNNFIGGNASNGSGTYTINGATGVFFWGMDINHFGSVPSSVQGNTITSISVTSTITGTTNDFFRGISTGSTGHVNIGTINGNTIGSGSVARAITLCTSGSLTNAYGIKNASTSSSSDTINIYNNIIGGITDSSTNAVSGSNLYGVAVTAGSFTNIVNNTIGSTTVANSINSPNASTAVQTVMGISVAAITNHISTITGNTIANLNNGYTSTGNGYMRGISVLTSGRAVINNNTVSNLSIASLSTSFSLGTACLIGIIANTSNTMMVSGNTVHSLILSNLTSTAASYVEGIVIGANGASPTHPITKNFVHSFDVLSPTNTNAVMVGMDILGGSNIFTNNMIRLGIKPDGTDLTNPILIRGFYLNSTAATNFYHNSIYIGGTNVGATTPKNSMAFHRIATGIHDIRNNVFVNERSNAVLGGGKHYQLFMANLVTVTLNNNIYYGTGNDAKFATPNGVNDSTVYSINWANTGDVGSGTGNPQFDAPNASAALVNLHIHPSNATSVESAGVLIASVTDDKDGDSRAANTPTDVGADAGNFVGVNMVIDSTVVDQNASIVVSSSTNQVVVGIRMYTKNGGNPLWVTGFDLNTATTSSNLDIENAKVFYTGSRSTFDTTSLFGVLNSIPNGSYSITGSDTLAPGLNYFWVTYDVKSTATPTNVIDARLDAITIVGSPLTNILYSGDPAGSRLIKAPLNGNYDIGTSGAYPTITAAVADLKILGVSGPVSFTLKEVLYSAGLGEVFPITVNSFAGASAVNKVTMFPGTGIVARIDAANATAAIDLNGAKYFVIDGRQDSTGVFTLGTNLQIVNTTGPSVRFINEASYNKLKYVDLKSNNSGVTTAAGAGVVNFGTTTGANGNDSNTIEYCNIHEEALGFPLIGISSIGSATTALTNNDGNKIDHCNIYNFFSAGTATAGIYVGANNGSWTITNNHVYQEALRNYTVGVTHRAFWITPNTTTLTSASGFVINDNFIGGAAADGSGTYQMTGTVSYLFHGMDIWVGAGAITSIQNNVITNMDITGAASTSIYGFNIEKGNVECGTIVGNLVGSTTTNGAIVFTTNASGGAILPYRVGGANTVTLKHNIASGINIAGNSPTIAASFFGMNLSGGTTVIADSNTIGSKTLANSITLGANTSTTASVALGIIINPGAMTSHTVRYNQISNITNNYSGASTAASVRALHVNPSSTGTVIVTDNTIEQIKNGAVSTGVGANAAMQGIIVGTTTATAITVSKNTVRSLVLTAATGAVTMNGIYYAGPTTGNHIVSRNMVHSLALSGANPAAIIAGIDIASGNVTTANNMVRLGVDSTGTAMTDACTIKGINKGTNNSRVIFNTVYIGGAGVGSDANRSIAFARTGTGVDTVRNNIFINQRERTNIATGGGHYAVSLNNATTMAMDYNLLVSNDSMGIFNSIKQHTLTDWKGASGTGVDANSISGASGLLNPTGTTATIDLHISAVIPTPIEGSGLVISGLGADVDFDGQDRTTLTPTDMGADAGDFIVNDIAAPSIVYTPLTNTTATTDRIVTATISDVTGVYLAGTLRPRIYFKNMDAGTYVSTQGVLVSGTKTNGTWDFTISESALGGIAGGDSIYYFVIAQDSTPANNVGSFPGGVTATDVNTVTVGPGVPSKYLITPFLSGTFTVGNTVASDFPSLTVAINYIGASVLAGPVILELMDPLYDKTTETFPIVFSPTTGASSTNNITVRPAAGVTALISDSITHTIFDLNGIDYLTIDGRQGGNGTPNSLTIQNRSISNVGYGTVATPVNNPNAIRFINDATFNTIKYANLQGASQTNLSGVVFFSIGTTVGNSNNTIQDCNIGNVPSVVLYPNNIFVGLGTATDSTKFNRNVLIKRNNIYNYFSSTGESNAFKVSKGNTEWTIDSNHFYQTATLTGTAGTQYLMNLNRRVGPTVLDDVYAFASLQNMVITNNYVGGSAPYAAGTPWTITGAGPNYAGLYGEYGLYSRARISGNTFANFEMNQNVSGNRWIAISVANGVANVDSNVIGSTIGLSAITVNSTVNGTGLVGIASSTGGIAGGRTRISYNKMGGITINGNATTSVNFTGISVTGTGNATQTYLIENNTIGNELANNIITTGASNAGTVQNMVGISSTNPSINTVRNNTIQNLTNTYTGAAASLTHAISLSVGVDTVSGNYISNLTNNAAQTNNAISNSVSVVGVQMSTTSTGNVVSQNTIRNLWNGNIGTVNVSVVGINANFVGTTTITNNNIYGTGVVSTSAGANVIGVASNSANSVRLYNNMISLGLDTSGVDMQNAVSITGILKNNTGSFAAYHNTVHIQGAGVGTNLGNTNAVRRSADGVDTLINNILINSRNNTGLGGGHYAVSLNTINTLTSHHNILNILTAPCDTLIGLDGNMGYLSLTDWQTFSGKEASSKDTTMAFVSSSNLHLNPSVYGAFTLLGDAVNGISMDIDGENRLVATPYIGADEIPGSPLPVHLLALTATAKSGDVYVVWSTASENNNKGFEIERSIDGKTFEYAGFVKGNNKNSVSNYNFMDAQAFVKSNQHTLYYRLKQVDLDGKFTYSNKVKVTDKTTSSNVIAAYPNPFNTDLSMNVFAESNTEMSLTITDIQGRMVATQKATLVKGMNIVNIDAALSLQKGIYFVQTIVNGEVSATKIVKH